MLFPFSFSVPWRPCIAVLLLFQLVHPVHWNILSLLSFISHSDRAVIPADARNVMTGARKVDPVRNMVEDTYVLSCALESRLWQVHVQDLCTAFLLGRGDVALLRFRLQHRPLFRLCRIRRGGRHTYIRSLRFKHKQDFLRLLINWHPTQE